MTISPEELDYLRELAPNVPDSFLVRKNFILGAGNVPEDMKFYSDLDGYAKDLGVSPEDLLVVLASESNFMLGTIDKPIIATEAILAKNGFDRSLLGADITPRGLPGFTASVVPTLMTADEWKRLPKMSAAEQLFYVHKMFKQIEDTRLDGRPFKDAFELYLANANPGSLSPSGDYNWDSKMYVGDAWATNLSIDRGKSGLAAGDYATRQGERDLFAKDPLGYAKNLVQKGIIKGYVSLGDLRDHGLRMTLEPGEPHYEKGWNLAWKLASKRLGQYVMPEGGFTTAALRVGPGGSAIVPSRSSAAASMSPSVPSFGSLSLLNPETKKVVAVGAGALLATFLLLKLTQK